MIPRAEAYRRLLVIVRASHRTAANAAAREIARGNPRAAEQTFGEPRYVDEQGRAYCACSWLMTPGERDRTFVHWEKVPFVAVYELGGPADSAEAGVWTLQRCLEDAGIERIPEPSE